MAKRRARKTTKQPGNNCHADGVPLDNDEEKFNEHEVDRQIAAIRALRDVEIEKLLTMLRLLRSYFSKDQLEVPVLQFFKENFPNLMIAETGIDGQHEVKLKDRDVNFSMNHGDERTLHTSLLHRLSVAYPDFSAGIPSLGGFEYSDRSVKTTLLGADKLQIRRLVLEEPCDSQMKDGLQTPNVSNNRLSVGITPKTLRQPKCGEMLLSVHGSPLGVFKEDNLETIKETQDS